MKESQVVDILLLSIYCRAMNGKKRMDNLMVTVSLNKCKYILPLCELSENKCIDCNSRNYHHILNYVRGFATIQLS